MNSLELIGLVLNTGLLIWVLTTGSGTKGKLIVFGFVSVLTAIQLLMGARWQLSLVYCMPLVTIIVLFYRHKKSKGGIKKWKQVLYTGGVLVFGAIAFAVPVLLPNFTFTEPTGSEEVGTTIFHLQDGEDELMVQVWYPAEADANQKKAAYIIDGPEVTDSLSKMVGFPGFALSHLQKIRTHSYLDAPISEVQQAYPVLLFNHGLGGMRNQNTFQMEELASHGYIVMGADQPGYAAATVFPDGTVVENQYRDLMGAGAPGLDTHMERWANHSKFLLDQLESLNQNEFFGNSMDLEKIGMFGHSYGGSTSSYMLINDERVKAALNMDGGIFGMSDLPVELDKPLLLMAAEASVDYGSFYRALDNLTEEEAEEQTGQTKEWHRTNMEEVTERRELMIAAGADNIVLDNATHASFSDLPLYSPFLLDPEDHSQEIHEKVNRATLEFFDKQLK